MIIFLNDDPAYLCWVRHHGAGFVLDARRKPGRRSRMLHRATCPNIRSGRRSHWTTGQRLKACSRDRDELINWAEETGGAPPPACEACSPMAASAPAESVPLTRLSSNVLNHVLETTVVQMTNGDEDQGITMAEVASCLGKTPAQLTAAVKRLMEGGYLLTPAIGGRNGRVSPRTLLAPTPAALRTLPGFAETSEDDLRRELARHSA
jgi:hypothetical protein